jgi:hypothetical protein
MTAHDPGFASQVQKKISLRPASDSLIDLHAAILAAAAELAKVHKSS